MNANRQDIERVLRCQQGIITRRGHPQLADAMAWMVKQGKLRAVLPGVYTIPSLEHDPVVRMRAATAWAPEAVLIGAAAAKLTFWPDIVLGDVQLAVQTARRPAKGFATVRRVIAPEHVVTRQAMRCTTPALTALDLCDSHGGDAIDAALRSRQTTLDALHEAFRRTAGRVGNTNRRLLLLDSRDEPWSRAERETHRLFRAEGLTGWVSNYPVTMLGWLYYLDVAFPEAMLAIEIDGRGYHGPDAFESDRWRQNDLILAGWRVLRFTWDMITRFPQVVVAAVRRALAS